MIEPLFDSRENRALGREGNCPACSWASSMLFEAIDAGMLFPKAFEVWMAQRSITTDGVRAEINYLAKPTERDYRTCARALELFFGEVRLKEITAAGVVEYQRMRATNPDDAGRGIRLRKGQGIHGPFDTAELAQAWAEAHGGGYTLTQTLWPRRAGANAIRKEVALLMRILRAARLWTEEESKMVPRVRAEESDIARAMTVEEQHRFLHVASSRAEFQFIYHYTVLALQTTAGPSELRWMRRSDVWPDSRLVQVPRAGAKNKHRARTIDLPSEDAVQAVRWLLDRARGLGATEPGHYLFPFRVSRVKWDATRPASESNLKKQWDAVRRAAMLPALRIYDLRHTGITRMAEAGVPLPVAMARAGHMTLKMQQRYISICMASQRAWGEQVWGAGRPGGVEAQQPRMPVAREGLEARAARHA